jgi:hypothetical protein
MHGYYEQCKVFNRFPDYRDGAMHNGPVPPFGYNKFDPFNVQSELSHGSMAGAFNPMNASILRGAYGAYGPAFHPLTLGRRRSSGYDSDSSSEAPRRRSKPRSRSTAPKRKTPKRKTPKRKTPARRRSR